MIALLVYAFIVFGIAWAIGHSHLSYPIRRQLRIAGFKWTLLLLECVGCFSWHLGWIAFVSGLAPLELRSWWAAAFFTAGTSLMLGGIARLLDEA